MLYIKLFIEREKNIGQSAPECPFKEHIKTAEQRTVIGTLTVDGWAVTFGTARRGLGGLRSRPDLSLLYQM